LLIQILKAIKSIKLRYFYLICLLILLNVGTAPGQISEPDKLTSGSIYSSLGVGTPVDYRASYADGMGLIGYAVYDSYAPSLANPALWGRNVFTQATGGVNLNRYIASDRQGSAKTARLSMSMFQGVFPLKKDKLSLSVSLHPLTRRSFTSFEQNTLPPYANNSRDTLVYGIEDHGSGGLNRLELGVGWKINKHLSLGYAGSYVYGPLQSDLTVIWSESEYQKINLDQTTSHQGFGNRFGVLVSPVSVLKPDDKLDIGLTATLPVNLNAKRIVESDKEVANRLRTIVIEGKDAYGTRTVKLPLKAGIGINYQPNALWSISSELKFGQWSEYNGFSRQQSANNVDRYKAGLGVRYRPYISDYETFWSRFKYNFGVSYDQGHLQLKGHRIETLMFSFGLGILSPDTRSSIDLNFHYGLRGTRADGLVRERIWGMRLSFNLAELMFFRPKLQ